MPSRIQSFGMPMVFSLILIIMGCPNETQKAASASSNTSTQKLLEQLTDVNEANREWFLMQSLDREELIVLSELDVALPLDKVKTY